MSKPGLTKQGVRDLSSIKSKSVGLKLDVPPFGVVMCQRGKHAYIETANFHGIRSYECNKCGKTFTE